MKPKLFIVEGLPGSGKTTWASSIHKLLRERGLTAQLHLEGDPRHPADYEATAWMTRRTYRQIRSQYPDHQEILETEPVDYFLVIKVLLVILLDQSVRGGLDLKVLDKYRKDPQQCKKADQYQ
mgnify:CR=1 FL=1